jgi:hypothetical protein
MRDLGRETLLARCQMSAFRPDFRFLGRPSRPERNDSDSKYYFECGYRPPSSSGMSSLLGRLHELASRRLENFRILKVLLNKVFVMICYQARLKPTPVQSSNSKPVYPSSVERPVRVCLTTFHPLCQCKTRLRGFWKAVERMTLIESSQR